MSRKLRVLQLGKYYPPHRGGIETHLQALTRHLKDRVDLTVLVASTESRTVNDVDAGVKITRVSTPWHFSSAPLCPTLTWHIKRAKPEITHIHWPNPMAYVAWKMAGSPGKLVVTYHSDIIRQRLLGRLYQPILDAMLGEAEAIIVLASRRYAETSSSLQAYLGKVQAIPHGLELERFTAPDTALLARLKATYPGPVVLAVGRLVYYKGFEHLVEAMRSVKATLLIIGSGPLKAELLAQAATAGVASRVHILEDISDEHLATYYHLAEIFVLPSVERSESFGMVQVEAMAAGTPVINTAIDSGVPEVSPHEVTGLTVPPRDASALAKALNNLLGNPQLSQHYGLSAKSRAHQEYSAERMAERTHALYRAMHGSLPGSLTVA